ncbi:hypothetical protein ACNKU7_02510 [Microbulbifer sp. SA54]|uniref:hypothetical protein n=1 Tax=Microbulbifer sp. SA54 TaxID=3401577 RepID=UPI003AAC47FF
MKSRKFNKFLMFLLLPLALVAGCAQQGSVDGIDAQSVDDGLLPRKTGLDSVSAAYAFDLGGAKVFLEPVNIEYRKRYHSIGSPLRDKDYELEDKDLARLQELMGETLAEAFLAPRRSELVENRADADYVLQLDLKRFALAAPLDPSAWITRVYADNSADGTLVGELKDSEGNPVMRFSDRREIGDNLGAFGTMNRYERFNRVTFWSDMKIDMRRAFSSLDKSLR